MPESRLLKKKNTKKPAVLIKGSEKEQPSKTFTPTTIL